MVRRKGAIVWDGLVSLATLSLAVSCDVAEWNCGVQGHVLEVPKLKLQGNGKVASNTKSRTNITQPKDIHQKEAILGSQFTVDTILVNSIFPTHNRLTRWRKPISNPTPPQKINVRVALALFPLNYHKVYTSGTQGTIRT